ARLAQQAGHDTSEGRTALSLRARCLIGDGAGPFEASGDLGPEARMALLDPGTMLGPDLPRLDLAEHDHPILEAADLERRPSSQKLLDLQGHRLQRRLRR